MPTNNPNPELLYLVIRGRLRGISAFSPSSPPPSDSSNSSSEGEVEVIEDLNLKMPAKKTVTPPDSKATAREKRHTLLEEELSSIQDKNKELERELLQARQQIKTLEKENAKLLKGEAKHFQTKTDNECLCSQQRSLKAQMDARQSQHSAEIARHTTEAQHENYNLKFQASTLEVKVDSLQSLLKQKDREILNLNKKLAGYNVLQQKNASYMLAEQYKTHEANLR